MASRVKGRSKHWRGGLPAAQQSLGSLDIYTGAPRLAGLLRNVDFESADTSPSTIKDAMELARDWHKKNLFVQQGLRLKIAVANYGFCIRPDLEYGQKLDEPARRRFTKWLRTNGPAIHRLVLETMEDWFIMDNAVAFWRKSGRMALPRVFSLRPELCKYTDPMGEETLKVRMGWKIEELKALPPEAQKRYGAAEIILDEEKGEYFRVLKRDRVGYGFAWPQMHAVFRVLNNAESHEVADNLWAFISRAVIRHFKIGHEIKQGPKAGQPNWFWNEKRDSAIRKFFEGRLGVMDYCSNFDTSLEYPFPSADRYDAKKYQSVWERLSYWLGPLGLVLMNRTANDFPLRLLRAWVEEERRLLRVHCEAIMREVFPSDPPAKLVWSNRVFMDGRQWLEFLKFMLQAGPLSQRSVLEEADFDPEEERERKAEEHELLQDGAAKGRVLPIFDPAHGKRPSTEGNGRPAGATDGHKRD